MHDGGGDRAPVERKRLQLAPRSEAGAQAAAARGGPKSNPFGAAKPREEVLAAAGVNAAELDKKIEKKAAPVRLTREQEEEIAAIPVRLRCVRRNSVLCFDLFRHLAQLSIRQVEQSRKRLNRNLCGAPFERGWQVGGSDVRGRHVLDPRIGRERVEREDGRQVLAPTRIERRLVDCGLLVTLQRERESNMTSRVPATVQESQDGGKGGERADGENDYAALKYERRPEWPRSRLTASHHSAASSAWDDGTVLGWS